MTDSLISTQWLGYLAATLTTGSFVPQALHTFRSNDLAGISLGMYGAFTLGVALWLLYGLALVFIMASLGVGLIISTIARNQVQAMQLSFFFMLPNILLSGYIFPRAAMPEPAQWIGALLPLTWFLEILRGILLKGVGVEDLWKQLAILTVAAFALLAISVRRFSKTLD